MTRAAATTRGKGHDQSYKEFKIVIHYDETCKNSHVSVTHRDHRSAQAFMSQDARKDLIQYPQFIANGWQIGSGPTEASCKTVTARLNRSGMRWNPVNAEAVANLQALHQNGQWETYWKQAA